MISPPNRGSPQQIRWAPCPRLGQKRRNLALHTGGFSGGRGGFGGRGLLLLGTLEILKETIQSSPRVFIFIDVLDQPPPPPNCPPELLELLQEIVRASPNTPVSYRETTFDNKIMRGFNEVGMPASPTHMDIGIYLEMRLDGGTDPDAMGDELRADIARPVPEDRSVGNNWREGFYLAEWDRSSKHTGFVISVEGIHCFPPFLSPPRLGLPSCS